MSISLSSLLGSLLRFAPSIILPIMISACGTMACLPPTPPPGAMAPIPAPVPLTPTPSPTSMSPVSTLTLSLISGSTPTAGLPSRLGSNGILRLLPGISDDPTMLREREEMERQKIKSLEAMLNAVLGREGSAPLGRPEEPSSVPYTVTLAELIQMSYDQNPMLKSRQK